MTDKIFELLSTNPLISIIGGILIILTFMFLFKDEIKKYLIKKLDVYTKDDMVSFAKFYIDNAQSKGYSSRNVVYSTIPVKYPPTTEDVLNEWINNK